jgi:tetratricopeptide (TPR) repeat protein
MKESKEISRRPLLATLLPALALMVFGALAASDTSAQRPGPSPGPGASSTLSPSPGIPTAVELLNSASSIEVSVYDEGGTLLGQQAVVKITGAGGLAPAWATTEGHSKVTFTSVAPSRYQIEVSSAEFQTTTQEIDVANRQIYHVSVTLKRDLFAAPPIVVPGQEMQPKARKEAQKGITALRLGNLKEAQKRLQAAYQAAPANADLDYLLGVLFEREKDLQQAQSYFEKATAIDSRNALALTALGQLRVQQNDYAQATTPLEQAVAVDSAQWMAHWLLAEAYLRQREFEKSAQQARLAVQTGKGAANGAELELGEALASLGRTEEATQTLQGYLRDHPGSQSAPAVREFMAKLQNTDIQTAQPKEGATPDIPAAKSNQGTILDSPTLAIDSPMLDSAEIVLSTPSWEPPSIDDVKPHVAAGLACPYQHVIDEAGKRVKELVDNVSRFGATENLLHEDLDELGKPRTKEIRKFDYLAAISESEPGVLEVQEFRTRRLGIDDFPNHIGTYGLPGLAFIFHPDVRDDFEMVCEGLGDWSGQATWLVHFRQRPERPSRIQAYKVTNTLHLVSLKGRAWISAGNFQIVRIEAELVHPMPEIRLLSEHQTVEYGPVMFQKKNTELWLPKTAELYFDFRKHRYYRRHSFDHYMLFSVDSNQKISVPKIPDEPQSPGLSPER